MVSPSLDPRSPVDTVWSWIMCFLLSMSNLFEYGSVSTYGILFPDILKEFNSGRAITAIPGSLGYAASLFGLVIGKLCDQYGSRKTILIGGLFCGVGLVVSSFTPIVLLLIVSFGLALGIGNAFIYFGSMVAVPLYFERYSFEATSFVSASPAAGLIIMTPVVQQLNKGFGWRTSMQFMAGFSAIPCIASLLMRSPKREESREDTDQAKTTCRCKIVDFSALRIRVFLQATVINVVDTLGHQMPFVHLAKYCEDIGIPSDRSSWLYFTIGISTTISRISVGKFGKKGCLSLWNILILGIMMRAVGNIILPSIAEYYGLVLYCVNYGIGDGLFATAIIHIVFECLPEHDRGGGFGLFQFFVGISYVIGPILSGFIADVTGSYSYAFYVAASLEILSAGLSLLVGVSKRKPREIGETVADVLLKEEIILERETVL